MSVDQHTSLGGLVNPAASRFFQLMVHMVEFVSILLSIILATFCNNRQEVFRFVYRIFVKNLLHILSPFDEKLLFYLMSVIRKSTILQVFLSQINHVDE